VTTYQKYRYIVKDCALQYNTFYGVFKILLLLILFIMNTSVFV